MDDPGSRLSIFLGLYSVTVFTVQIKQYKRFINPLVLTGISIIMRAEMITFTQSCIALLSATMGAILAVSVGVSHRRLCALISFAAGTLIATTLIHILPEARGVLSLPILFSALFSGYGLFFLISRYVFHVCPACSASHFEEHTASEIKSIAILLFVALGIHSTLDGVAISVGHEMKRAVDLSIFMAITIHKFPEGLALCALLLKAGFDRIKSLGLTLLLESTTLLGWVLGNYVVRSGEESRWFQWILVHIGGGFIYLGLHAVLNESKKHSPRFIFFFFLAGILTISLTLVLRG